MAHQIPNQEEQQKVLELYQKSRGKAKSDDIRRKLLNQSSKIITEDETTESYSKNLDSIITKLRLIGFLYNEAFKMLNSYPHSRQPKE